MAHALTNQKLAELLSTLGFEPGEATKKKHRFWRHPESGCTLPLPVNKLLEAPRPANLIGIKAHLNQHGHLDEEAFDFFAAEGRLRAGSTKR